ncbi:Uncharacterized protein FKW44_014894 [Caligus rogercresseyi]|uniref:Uncharacterized protein n=1 Tax=Caligus rogercresseyi TaxID=217165 RepID=A0A7T8GZM4_CALRO|nr:Uncharacterized protein FKW44_014894 [Caligus rogercresseyi]
MRSSNIDVKKKNVDVKKNNVDMKKKNVDMKNWRQLKKSEDAKASQSHIGSNLASSYPRETTVKACSLPQALMANLVPRSNGNVTVAINNHCTPHFEDQSGPITTHTSIPKEHESSFLPPLYPCKRPTISPESPCPLQPSTSSYKGPHRAPTPLWLQGYNYSPCNTHS